MRRPDYSRHATASPAEALVFRIASLKEPLLEGVTRWHITKDYVSERASAGKGIAALVRASMKRLDGRYGKREKWTYTRQHSIEVAGFSYIMSKEAGRQGLPEADRLDPALVFAGGLVHDIGKTFLPIAIVVKELGVDFGLFTAFGGSRLNDAEKAVLRNEHIATGTRYVRLFGGGPHIRMMLDMVGLHHVSFNGEDGGVPSYPSLVRGMDLPFHSRIAKAADLLSAAMPRHYRQNGHVSTLDDSVAHAIAVAGMEADPAAVRCFITGNYDMGWEQSGELVERLSLLGRSDKVSDTGAVRIYARDFVKKDMRFRDMVGTRRPARAAQYEVEVARCFQSYGIQPPLR